MGTHSDYVRIAGEAIDASRKLRKFLYDNNGGGDGGEFVGAVVDLDNCDGGVKFFVSSPGNLNGVEAVSEVVYEDEPEKYVWERGCLLRCQLPIKLPFYYPVNRPNGEFF